MIDYMKLLKNNKYVERIENDKKIVYNDLFYEDLYKNLQKGMGDVEAYEDLGFDTTILGVDRAHACARRARNKAKNTARGFDTLTISPGKFNGTIKRDDLSSLTKDELLAYMVSRNMYLEAVDELQKKTVEILQGKSSSQLNKK